MKKLFLILFLMAFVIVGCAGVQLKGDVKDILIEEVAWEAGYFTAKEYPEIAKNLEKGAILLKLIPTEADFHKWVAFGIKQVIKDPLLVNRFTKLSELFQVDVSGIEDLAKRSERIGELMEEFCFGVEAGLIK